MASLQNELAPQKSKSLINFIDSFKNSWECHVSTILTSALKIFSSGANVMELLRP
jgi:hypothetical protein